MSDERTITPNDQDQPAAACDVDSIPTPAGGSAASDGSGTGEQPFSIVEPSPAIGTRLLVYEIVVPTGTPSFLPMLSHLLEHAFNAYDSGFPDLINGRQLHPSSPRLRISTSDGRMLVTLFVDFPEDERQAVHDALVRREPSSKEA